MKEAIRISRGNASSEAKERRLIRAAFPHPV
jgi:hypothetical protein